VIAELWSRHVFEVRCPARLCAQVDCRKPLIAHAPPPVSRVLHHRGAVGGAIASMPVRGSKKEERAAIRAFFIST